MSLNSRVSDIFQKIFKIEPEEFSPELRPEDLLLWDSLGHMNLVMEIEDRLGVHFEADEITEMTSAKKIVELLQTKGVGD
jgi:acyl carrier protein